jgi:hypothetical protein
VALQIVREIERTAPTLAGVAGHVPA